MTSGTLVTLAPAASGPVELAAAARDCQAVGAAVLVLPPLDGTAATEALAAVREETDLLVQAGQGVVGADLVTAPLDLPEERLAELSAGAVPPVFTARELTELAVLRRLVDRHGPPAAGPVHVTLVLGDPGGLPAGLPAVATCLEQLPVGSLWSAVGLGAGALPVLLSALAAGGHVRTGTADGPDGDSPDLQLVARAAGLARIAQRPPLPPTLARTLLTGPPGDPAGGRAAVRPTRSVEVP